MMCMFCGNRGRCWDDLSDELLEEQWVKCGYEDYTLDDSIELEDLLAESERREEAKLEMEDKRNVS